MSQQNLFDGDSYQAIFARIIYRRLKSGREMALADVMADFCENTSPHQAAESMDGEKTGKGLGGTRQDIPVSKRNHYGELKKAFGKVKKAIIERTGQAQIKIIGNNKNRRYQYCGKEKDPLADLMNETFTKELRGFWAFCKSSGGLFPLPCLKEFFKNSMDLLEEIKSSKEDGNQVLSLSIDRHLTNIEYLPLLYNATINKQVLEIEYKPFGKEQETLEFHPHYLKEFNGRWHLFGHAYGHLPNNGYDIALDRIQAKPKEKKDAKFIEAPPTFYKTHFQNIVGISHSREWATIERITIRAHTLYMYKLVETKPFHQSQKPIVKFSKHEDGTYGEFTIEVEVNNELIGQILQMGPELEVMSPSCVRNAFAERVYELSRIYLNLE